MVAREDNQGERSNGLAALAINRRDGAIVAALLAAALLTRLPFLSQTLYNWDAASFALSLERFSISDDQPHAPGYILYVLLGRIANFFWGDANAALVALSLLAGALAVPLLYLLGRAIFDRATGLVAALMLICAPLGWFYGEVALSYGVELPLALVAIWLLYQLFFYRRYAVAAAVVIGFAAGFRQDVLLFLGPFWLAGSARLGRRVLLLSGLALVAAILAWFLPLISLSGGLALYRQRSQAQFSFAVYPTSILAAGLAGIRKNLEEVLRAFLWLFGSFSLLLAYLGRLYAVPGETSLERRIMFLTLLALPALLFFILFHFGQPGYLLVFGAPLLLLLARTLVQLGLDAGRLWRRRLGGGPQAQRSGLAVIVVLLVLGGATNSFLYLRAADFDWELPGSGGALFSSVYGLYSAAGIEENDNQLQGVLETVKRFSPLDTMVVSVAPYNRDLYDPEWRRLMYYLPDYRVMMLHYESGDGYSLAQDHYAEVVTGVRDIVIPQQYKQVLFISLSPHYFDKRADLNWKEIYSGTLTPVSRLTLPADGVVKVGPYQLHH